MTTRTLERTLVPTLAPTGVRSTGRTRLVAVLAVLATILVELWLVSGLAAGVADRTPARSFQSPLGTATWISAPGGGSHAWFRMDFGLRAVPLRALLWTQGQQFESVFVNGYRVAEALQQELPGVDTAPDILRRLQPLDVTAALRRGRNAVGLEVVDRAHGPAAARAVLTIDYGLGPDQSLGASPTAWRVTSDVQQTYEALPGSGSFSVGALDDSRWQSPVLAGSAAAAGQAGSGTFLPPAAFDTGAVGEAMTGPGSFPLSVTAHGEIDRSCSSTWLSVASSGPLEGIVDGDTVVSQSSGAASFGDRDPLESSRLSNSTPEVTLDRIFDLTGIVRGTSRLTVSLATEGASLSSIYATVECEDGGRTVPIIADGGWSATTDDGHYVGLSASLFGDHPLSVAVGDVQGSGWAGTRLHRHLVLLAIFALGVAALGALIGIVRRRLGVRGTLVASLPLGLLPASALVLALGQLTHWVDVTPPFPYVPGVEVVVLIVAAVGVIATALWLAAPGRTPGGTPPSLPSLPSRTEQGSVGEQATERRFAIAVVLGTAALCVIVGWDIRFEPLWQDELSSLAAAQGMQLHILPEWPSGFLYWKSELYSALIAVVGGVTGNSVAVLRLTTVATYGATVVAFALGLTKLVWRRRWALRLGATAVFALAPFELGHARDIRMYQLAQLLVVAVLVLFFRALRHPSRRNIWLTALAVSLMYLAHEETFILLPVLPISFVLWRRTTWPHWRRWLLPAITTGGLICVQLALAKLTHPPAFGDDASGGPLIHWSPAPFYYLDNFFLIHTAYGASITTVSSLALIGMGVGFWRRSAIRVHLALFTIVPLVVVSTILPAKDTRYCFVLLPTVFLLGFLGMCDIVDLCATALRNVPSRGRQTERSVRRFLVATGACCLILSTAGSMGDYGPLVSDAFHANLAERQQDYGAADKWVRLQSRPGDLVVASGTVNLTGYGLGRTPDYWLAFRRDSRLLFLIEKHDQPVDTQYGIPVIDDATALERVVDSRRRVWLVIGDKYVGGLLRGEIAILQSQFRLVYESEVVSVFESGTVKQ